MLRLCLLLLSIVPLLLSFATNAQSVISVASATQSDSSLASPSEFLGYPLGQWHLRHDQINYYLKQLAQNSPRVSLESTGQSHETRQQLTAVITSAANQARLAEIVQGRQQVKAGKAPESPLIICWPIRFMATRPAAPMRRLRSAIASARTRSPGCRSYWTRPWY